MFPTASRRLLTNTAVVEGFFGFAWFGWGHAGPPDWARPLLVIGQVISLAVAVTGFLLNRKNRGGPPAIANAALGKRFGIIAGAEFALIGIGSGILAGLGLADYIAGWTCLVVGIHFIPLRWIFPGMRMPVVAVVLTLVALGSVLAQRVGVTTGSTVTGLGAGTTLLVHSGLALITGVLTAPRQQRTATEPP